MHIVGLDDIDNKILTLLKENARASYSEIAEQVGLTRVAVKNRIQAMEETGVICGYQAKIAPAKAGLGIEFIVTISPKTETYEYVLSRLAKSPLIHKLVGTSGDCKIIAYGIAPNTEYVNEFYRRARLIFTDVNYFFFDVITSTYKDVDGGIEYERVEEKPSDAGKSDS